MSTEGYVYILTNPVMQGLIKIGKTSRTIEERVKELNSTGVPMPFKAEYSRKVERMDYVECDMHQYFDADRVNDGREFFKVDPQVAVAQLDTYEEALSETERCRRNERIRRKQQAQLAAEKAEKMAAFAAEDRTVEAGFWLKAMKEYYPQDQITHLIKCVGTAHELGKTFVQAYGCALPITMEDFDEKFQLKPASRREQVLLAKIRQRDRWDVRLGNAWEYFTTAFSVVAIASTFIGAIGFCLYSFVKSMGWG